jgi:UDP-GlcNAc:undecaprenyl-phosphate GlcNAc-1-phosphate transferase
MPQILTNPFVLTLVGLVTGVIMTLIVRASASRLGFVAKPKADRWHKRPTAMLGGAAIFLTTLTVYFAFVPLTRDALVVLGASSFLFLVGLVDDVLNVRPYQKLIGQLIGAGVLIFAGLKMPITGYEIVDIWITVFWVVGITNAINLLDNMDGLAAGISAIAAISLAINFAINGGANETLLLCAFIGALLGFLIFNSNPASIFMGDCGSMFIGFFLSSSVLLSQIGGRSRGVLAVLAVPVLILFVPIFDTTFVTILRKLRGQPASQGGRDHTSHRLVALGLSERSAVWMLYGFAGAAAVLAWLVNRLETTQSLALIVLFIIVLVIIGVYLSKVKAYEVSEVEAIEKTGAYAFLVNISHKRRIFEVFLDGFLITLAYYGAFVLLFGPIEQTTDWDLFIRTLPLIVLIQLAAFLFAGVYRGLWRYTSLSDLMTFIKAVALGSGLSIIAVLLLYRFQYFSRAVFVLDALLLLLAVIGSRMAFRLIRYAIPASSTSPGRNVLIYGAGDGGEMVLRELQNNPGWEYKPVGFIDDDPLKKGKVVHGLTVYDGNGSLGDLCRKKDVVEILISARDLGPERLKSLRDASREAGVELKRAHLTIEPVDFA